MKITFFQTSEKLLSFLDIYIMFQHLSHHISPLLYSRFVTSLLCFEDTKIVLLNMDSNVRVKSTRLLQIYGLEPLPKFTINS